MSSFLPFNAQSFRRLRGVVTREYFGDPPLGRAGQVPDCEEARQAAEAARKRRLQMPDAEAPEDRERLAPRRFRPSSGPLPA